MRLFVFNKMSRVFPFTFWRPSSQLNRTLRRPLWVCVVVIKELSVVLVVLVDNCCQGIWLILSFCLPRIIDGFLSQWCCRDNKKRTRTRKTQSRAVTYGWPGWPESPGCVEERQAGPCLGSWAPGGGAGRTGASTRRRPSDRRSSYYTYYTEGETETLTLYCSSSRLDLSAEARADGWGKVSTFSNDDEVSSSNLTYCTIVVTIRIFLSGHIFYTD